jgi:hypothetical protein
MDWIYLAQERKQWRAVPKIVMNEPSGSTKCWEILKRLRDWQRLEKDSVP